MDFSNIARQLNETSDPSVAAAQVNSEKATAGGEVQQTKTRQAHGRQKAQMAQTTAPPKKSDVSYASEEARTDREATRMMESQKSDWRQELMEAAGEEGPNHPFVDVMPFLNQKQDEAKRQMKAAAAAEKKGVAEGSLNPFQVHFDKDGKEFKSKGSKRSADRIRKNISSNRKSGPMAQDPYKSRAGESD